MLTLNRIVVYGVFGVYTIVSKLILDKIYASTKTVIDEAFHIPQAIAYCNFNFSTWNPKITTLPGLYLISALFLGPFGLCEIYWFRFLNYLTGVLNLILVYVWFTIQDDRISLEKRLLSSLNIALLPPLYFFSHLYYTDVLSLASVLLVLIFNKREKHFLASFSGMISVIIRQTNIIWILMVFGDYFLKNYYNNCLSIKYKKAGNLQITENNIKELSWKHLKKCLHLQNLSIEIWINIFAYCSVLVAFVVFLILNEGIVIGDKAAHAAVIHIPQIFYFSLFSVIFAWPHFIPQLIPFLQFVLKRRVITLLIIIMMAVIIYSNTLVHPYLLADNRHYTFYIWNRLYNGIYLFRYIAIGVYLFGLYCLFANIYSRNDILFAVMYIPCTIFVLILQKMIEVRYFFIPYILFRLHLRNPQRKFLILELISHCVISYVTLKLFFSKDIFWTDFDYAQKLIW